MQYNNFPKKQGLYDPSYEHDSCGVGFLCDIKGKKSNATVLQSLEALRRLAHRGATGADPKTGDGAGILLQIPHDFLVHECSKLKIDLPQSGSYGTGTIFFPKDKKDREFCKDVFKKAIEAAGQKLLGYRDVPLDNSVIGETAKLTEPVIEQIFIGKGPSTSLGVNSDAENEQLDFGRKLYVIRKEVETTIRNSSTKQKLFFYITNISSRTMLYKGLLMPDQVENFFLDLKDPRIVSALCLVHSRYSTNTFPTWDLAQPFRFLAHNGEINTLRGNINWMRAREGLLKSEMFGSDIEKLKPIIVPGGSDSAAIDNALELLILSGRSLPHSMMMLIPGAWEQNKLMDEGLKDFYKFHACFMEPWDGPAAMAFTDGTRIGALLDRNGLRPARYLITKDDKVLMASELGVLDIDPKNIKVSGRLEPGKIFFIDTEEGRIVNDHEVKKTMSERKPYRKWLTDNLVDLDQLTPSLASFGFPPLLIREGDKRGELLTELSAFGYTREDLKIVIKPMAETGKEPIGSMGNDTPISVLSKHSQSLYSYFKQLFAQVTNPPIDPIREECVMGLDSFVGSQKNILDETPEHCQKLYVKHPILTNDDLNKIVDININGFKTKIISILFPINDKNNLVKALDNICTDAVKAIKDGYSFIVLSDRGVGKEKAAIPALLAVGAVHQHLIKNAMRTQIGIILESGEPREVHHFGVLFGFGADCINPYLAYEVVEYLITDKQLDIDPDIALKNYRKSIDAGMLKILSKMGISTLQSYRGAQIFEALGISDEVIEKCFTGTTSRIGGVTFETIAIEILEKHRIAYPKREESGRILPPGGLYQFRRDGEFHLWNPESISAIQDAAKKNDHARYKEFAALINDQSKNPTTIRGVLKFKKTNPILIESVEPIGSILKRFVTGAMSFGSISRGAHETLAIAMNHIHGRSNTGEGGEDPARFADNRRSAVKQVASGRFGVTTNYLVNADEIQIKMAQGAKPGEGGQLPGHKVSAIIAKTRYTTQGVTLISPPPHHDIYSIEDLAQLIFDLKNVNPRAMISVKLVSEIGVGTVAAGVAKGHADMILVSGGDGGTGASPISSIKHAGLPWELGISETHQTLVLNDLRSRVRLQTDGQMRTGRDVAIAAILGAEEYGFCTAALIVMGCVMLRHCHLNNCSVGVATQDDILEAKFAGNPDHVVNYFTFIASELREIMASLGISKIDDLVGRVDLLETNTGILSWKSKDIDLSKVLYKPEIQNNVGIYRTKEQDHGIDNVLDRKLIKISKPALNSRKAVLEELKIQNVNRTTGAMLSGEICKRFGESGLPDDTIKFKFNGVAGQSFGAFLAKGATFELEGFANDYVGKGISGGKVIIYPDKNTGYKPDENILIGNTAFYGAINGEAYIKGVAGERFCIRNSGLNGVVEGVGDHGCEYMTGGHIVILGATGRNFGAGMSGGVAYVYDLDKKFKDRCNFEMIELQELDERDRVVLYDLLRKHHLNTNSLKAKYILDNLDKEIKKFVKVMPIEYKRLLEQKKLEEKLALDQGAD
ncbi:glutamate synthase large subunit [Candidatus Saganbacteria bacterium]|nr:glutamate synthase large subunit [Candidatus Saganbacteria bacterium]